MHPVGGVRTVSRRRVWLLDVDGVINASRPGWSERPHRAEITANGQLSMAISMSPLVASESPHLA